MEINNKGIKARGQIVHVELLYQLFCLLLHYKYTVFPGIHFFNHTLQMYNYSFKQSLKYQFIYVELRLLSNLSDVRLQMIPYTITQSTMVFGDT